MISCTRIHDFCAGHRVVGHEHRCRHLHGHNYRVTFECSAAELDAIGRVVDFQVIKTLLCQWLEDNWDHHMLLWQEDELAASLEALDDGVVRVPFNPTAENMADHLLRVVGPEQLAGTGVDLIRVTVEETRKCSAEARL
jgi:6-pyruvoyltetrahydropterin/6-carboxytetrahydropterin synthase